MRYISILTIQFFCLTAPIQSTHNLLQTVPSYSQTVLLTEKQGLQSKYLNLPPRLSIFWKFLPKFFHWKHFMELECFKDICTYYRDYSDKIRQKQMSSSLTNNQKQNFQKLKETRYQTMREYPNRERIIFWSPESVSLMKKQPNQKLNKQTNKQNVTSTTEPQLDINNYRNSFDIRNVSTTTERKEGVENSQVPPDKYHHRKAVPGNNILLNFFKKPNLVEPSTENTRNNFLPYEVEEIIEEKYETELNDENNESLFKEKETKTVNSDKEIHYYNNIMENSINSILNKLLSSTKQNKPVKEKNDFNTLLPSKETNKWTPSGTTDTMRTSTEGRYKNEKNVFIDIFNSVPRPTPQQKQIFGNWRQKSSEKSQILGRKFFRPEMNTRMNNSRRIDFIPFSENILSSDSHQINMLSTSSVLPDNDLVGTEDSEVPLTVTSNSLHLFSTPTQNLPDFTTGNGNKDTTETEKLTTGKPLDTIQQFFFSTFPNNTSEANVSTKYATEHQMMQTEAEILPTSKDFQETIENVSETYLNYEEITKEYTEFTDQPMSFDLLATTVKSDLKKDLQGGSKNSRKMHFENSQEPTVSNEIYDDVETEQRRSDILIADNIADYIDEENNLPYISYIENLKQNNSLLPHESKNSTSDALIPLISRVINDLRERKIPSEDFSILSEALGKFWKPILALSNMTNLDMLPLLKMKTEKDLENFLQNFLPEETTTSTTTENNGKADEYYGEMYDYMDQYKDLYKDVLGQDDDMKKRRLRPKRDTEIDTDADTDYLQALEARREYFESLEEEQNNEESHYIFEDIMYDEMLDDGYSTFDLKKMTNVQIDPET